MRTNISWNIVLQKGCLRSLRGILEIIFQVWIGVFRVVGFAGKLDGSGWVDSFSLPRASKRARKTKFRDIFRIKQICYLVKFEEFFGAFLVRISFFSWDFSCSFFSFRLSKVMVRPFHQAFGLKVSLRVHSLSFPAKCCDYSPCLALLDSLACRSKLIFGSFRVP